MGRRWRRGVVEEKVEGEGQAGEEVHLTGVWMWMVDVDVDVDVVEVSYGVWRYGTGRGCGLVVHLGCDAEALGFPDQHSSGDGPLRVGVEGEAPTPISEAVGLV